MSTKLDDERLAYMRWPYGPYRQARFGYAAAIREVAQPIADERDELRAICEALIAAHDWAIANPDSPISATINFGHVAHDARQLIAKYPKP